MIVSLVLPCYNPPGGWEQVICANYRSIEKMVDGTLELIVVMDGNSATVTDAAIAYLEQHIRQIKIIRYLENRGKGYAIRQGVAEATGDIIIYTDIDFPYTIESMYSIYRGLSSDECDVAVGVKDAAYYDHVPFLRRAISQFLRFFIRLFLSMPITDTQCGLKGFKKNVKPLFLQTTIDRYLFDLEFVRNCFKSKNYRVKAVPVTLTENVQFRSMNYRVLLPEALNFIKLLFK
jgi:glycosyltransferase involved in cell wall biosynthesis